MQKLVDGPVWISDREVQGLLSPEMAFDAVGEALMCHAAGDFDQPLKPYVRPGGREDEADRGRLITMPCYVGGEIDALGAKLIAGFSSNAKRNLPRASGVVVLHDSITGLPAAILDCKTLSARRTAAVAAHAVKHLAPRAAIRIALVGAGPINHEVVTSLLSLDMQIEAFNICDLSNERLRGLKEFVRANFVGDIVASDSAEECVRKSDVIITAVTGTKGYLDLRWLPDDNWLVVPLSLDDCMPDVLLSADKLVVDDFDQCNREEKLLHRLTTSGQLTQDQVYANLGQITSGMREGRSGSERIYANLMGMAVEDIAVAARVFRAACNTSNSPYLEISNVN